MSQGVRLALAFFISMAIMVVYSTFIAPPMEPQAVNTPQPKSAITQTTSATEATLSSDNQNAAIAKEVTETIAANETSAEAKEIVVTTPVSTIKLDTRGAVLTGYQLREFKTSVDKDSEQIDLLKDHPNSKALFLGLDGIAGYSDQKVFEVVADDIKGGARVVHLRWKNDQVQIDKTFTFGSLASNYGVQVDYQVSNVSDQSLQLNPYFQTHLTQKAEEKKDDGFLSFLKFEQPNLFSRVYFKEKSLEQSMEWDEFSKEKIAGKVNWAGFSDRYFLYSVAPEESKTLSQSIEFDKKGQTLISNLSMIGQTVNPKGGAVAGTVIAYMGPKQISELEGLGMSLDKAVDYGWFSILAVPILMLMKFLHTFIPNWGLVIIALTFIIKLALHPINRKSMESMKGMQQLQPKLAEIKKKFPEDKEKQNQEIMKLFRTHKVNPMGGCLPMLLQMPIYIVLYRVLWNSIELYHAPFFGPYQDLSAPDPFFILPILLGVFMFLQQKLTPSPSADPAQQKMMMFMPIMFTGFMLFLPVGLVVYIFVNTVVSVVQQFMIKREISFKQFVTGKWQTNGA